jgi:hypothetical protein
MTKNTNTIKPKSEKAAEKPKARRKPNGFMMQIHSVLDGSFINSGNLTQKILFILFLATLGLVYIANNHIAEKKTRQITKLTSQIKESNYNYLMMRTKLNEKKRASYLTKKLEPIGIKPAVEPPEKIYTKP